MPVTYEIDIDRQLILSRLVGAVSEEEIFEHIRILRGDSEFNPDFRQLVDLTGLTEIRVGSAMIIATSREHCFSPGVRRAFVASSKAAFGMARMYALNSESLGQTIEVFSDMDDAEGWLNR